MEKKKEQNHQVGYYRGLTLEIAQNIAKNWEEKDKFRVEINPETFEVVAFDSFKR